MQRKTAFADLAHELTLLSGKEVYIGARSSFFFVGSADEALSDLNVIADILRATQKFTLRPKRPLQGCNASSLHVKTGGARLGARRVKQIFERGDGSYAIIVEGNEFGTVWFRDEYLAEKAELQRARASARKPSVIGI